MEIALQAPGVAQVFLLALLAAVATSRRTVIQYYGYDFSLCAFWLVSSASR